MRRFALLLLLIPTLAYGVGETLYINGACSTAGGGSNFNGNGTASTCAASAGAAGAWLSPSNISCGSGTGQLGAGDTLEIKGGTSANNGNRGQRWGNINSACAGTSSQPIIIQNVSGEDAVFTGEVDIKGNTWTSRGAGVYECTAGSSCTPPNGGNDVIWQAWYTIGAGSEQKLTLTDQTAASCVSGSVAAGHIELVTGTGRLCANIDGSTSPAATNYFRVPTLYDFVEFFHGGNNWITMRKNPGGGSFTIQRYSNYGIEATASASTGLVFDGIHVGWVNDRCLDVGAGSAGAAGFIVRNCIVDHCGQEGIRIQGDTGGPVIEGNTVSEIQTVADFDLCADDTGGCRRSQDNGSGIRHASTTNNTVIRSNVIGNTTSNIKRFEALDDEGGCNNLTVEKNYVYGWHVSSGFSGANGLTDERDHARAFGISSSSGGNNTWSNCVWQNNRAYDVDNGILWDGVGTQSGTVGSSIINNTVVNPLRAAYVVFRGTWNNAGWTLKNNIAATMSGTPGNLLVNISATAGSAFSVANTTFNDFYCAGCSAGTQIANVKGTTAVATQASVTSLDANSKYGTPNVDVSASPPTLKLITAGGSAFGTGTCTGAPTTDFENDARPLNGTCEIGADEYNAANAGTTTTTSSTTTTTVTTSTTSTVTTSTTTGTGTTTTTIPGMFR